MAGHSTRTPFVSSLVLAAVMSCTSETSEISARLAESEGVDPIPVSLDAYFDNDGIDFADLRDGNFDGSGYVYPAEELPSAGPITLNGIPFQFPSSAPGAMNNVVALGQAIALPPGRYHGAYLLLAASYGASSGLAMVNYADGSAGEGPS